VVDIHDGHVGLTSDDIVVDITVRAPTSDLLLLLWRRVAPDGVEVDGERSALERFLAISDLT
jgi:hypothetical protein